jgi:hypothetical protein
MPEFGCLRLADNDIRSKAHIDGETSGLSADTPQEFGMFKRTLRDNLCYNVQTGDVVFHPKLLANPNGARQSVTLHYCDPNDPLFLPLPKPRKAGKWATDGCCSTCATTIYDDGEVPTFLNHQA